MFASLYKESHFYSKLVGNKSQTTLLLAMPEQTHIRTEWYLKDWGLGQHRISSCPSCTLWGLLCVHTEGLLCAAGSSSPLPGRLCKDWLSGVLEFLPRHWLLLPFPLIFPCSLSSPDGIQCTCFVPSVLTVEIHKKSRETQKVLKIGQEKECKQQVSSVVFHVTMLHVPLISALQCILTKDSEMGIFVPKCSPWIEAISYMVP